MPAKTRITRNGTIHYLECITCGKEKTTRTQRQKRLCRSCSDRNRRSKDIADDLRQCIKCEMVYPRDAEHFYSKGHRPDGTKRLDTTCKACDDKRKREWNENNRDKKNAVGRRSFAKYYQKNRQNPHWVLKRLVSTAICNTLKKRGVTKDAPTWQVLPYTPQQLCEHLEAQFDDKMSWDNYGSYWHVDHVYPQSLLPYDSYEHPNFLRCWDLDNLRPLEAIKNIRKGNKVI